MNKEKYKSIVVDIDTYKFIKSQACEDERAISKTLKHYFIQGVESEVDECNLDSKLVMGGTPRLHRLLQDLRWYRDNSGTKEDKKYVLNKDEQNAINMVIVALADTIE